jgi:hypothetical protein
VKENIVAENYISRIGQLWNDSIGIWAWQSGHNLISRNTLSDLPYTAIAATGRANLDPAGKGESSRTVRWKEIDGLTHNSPWEAREFMLHSRGNRIEFNDISNVIQLTDDGNGIYVSGAGRANLISRNLIHNTPSTRAGEAIRCDDDQNDVTISRNVVFRFGGNGTGICTKGRNHILNNLVALPWNSVQRGMLSFELGQGTDYRGSRIVGNILVGDAKAQPFMFRENLSSQSGAASGAGVDGLTINHNIYFNRDDNAIAQNQLNWARAHGWDVDSVAGDPGLANVNIGDFRPLPHSPAKRIGWDGLQGGPLLSCSSPFPASREAGGL